MSNPAVQHATERDGWTDALVSRAVDLVKYGQADAIVSANAISRYIIDHYGR